MERKIVSFFQKWKKDIIRKPLILYGPKQIGKTFTALEFGKNEYKNVVYFNTANNKNQSHQHNVFVRRSILLTSQLLDP